MRFRANLRYRVSMAFALLGALVSVGIGVALYVLTVGLEQRLIAETLSAELEDYILRYAADPHTPPPSSTTLRTYVGNGDEVPSPLKQLEPGLHRLRLDGRGYFVSVREQDGRHFSLLYDDGRIRQREAQSQIYFLSGALVMTLVSAVLGFWLADRVISPVAELARRVARLRPEDGPAPLAGDFPADEVGELARDFDAYLERLAAFMERERAFTSDVSHELRTPLTVIRGATDVLLADSELDATRRQRIERIARSVQEMSEMTEALLMLAREDSGRTPTAYCEVGELLRQVVEGHRHLLRHKAVEVELLLTAGITLPAECALLRVVLANLIRNAFSYTEQGHVQVCLDAAALTVKDTGSGIPSEQLQQVFERYYKGVAGGEGIGLSLVKRICQRYGWRIAIESCAGCGTVIRLSFKSDAPAGESRSRGRSR